MASTQEWIDELKGISVLELSERIKALEEEFGVSATAVAAAAPAAGAAGGGGGARPRGGSGGGRRRRRRRGRGTRHVRRGPDGRGRQEDPGDQGRACGDRPRSQG